MIPIAEGCRELIQKIHKALVAILSPQIQTNFGEKSMQLQIGMVVTGG
jgi:hypothetical protein